MACGDRLEDARMPKDKGKKNKKGDGQKAGGGKISKELRKAGRAAAKLADHPVISDVIAAGLLAAAAALTQTKEGKRALKEAGEGVEDAAADAARQANRFKRAAQAAAGAMGDRIMDEVKGAVAGKGKRKKQPAE
jgi:hypothetical protein